MFAHDHPQIVAHQDHRRQSGATEPRIVVAQALAPAEVAQLKNLISSLTRLRSLPKRARRGATRNHLSWNEAAKFLVPKKKRSARRDVAVSADSARRVKMVDRRGQIES
jgi:hypothetical protein